MEIQKMNVSVLMRVFSGCMTLHAGCGVTEIAGVIHLHAAVYPSLWRTRFPKESRPDDQHDAFCIAAWLARADRDGTLGGLLKPELAAAEREVAHVKGWILGVPGLAPFDISGVKQTHSTN
ncbi:MAG TPA: hypothetical protein VJ349_12120 [Stellaceae bacterium]|nr:hypothetical protein [Stellaceae bacterium]